MLTEGNEKTNMKNIKPSDKKPVVSPNNAYKRIIKLEDEELSSLFHRLWTKSVGTVSYDKEQWKRLQVLLRKNGIVT